MNIFLQKIGAAIITFGIAFGGLFGAHVQTPDYTQQIANLNSQITALQSHNSAPTLGAYNPSGGGTYRLQSSIGTTNTSITLSSFKEPISNIPYTMSYLNSSIGYGTLDPQSSRSEFISFTGITQNSDGTAILTGVSRGMGRSYPYTASTTLRQAHSGQSIFILSDSPQHFSEYAVLKNDQTITGSWSFPTPTIGANAATMDYVNGKAFGGIGNASETATGTVQIATGLQTASSTSSGTLGRLAIPASLATSTYNSATAPLKVVVTNNNGTIDPNFLTSTTTKSMGFATSTYVGSTYAFDIGKHEQVFSASTTWSIPNGIRTVYVRLVGAGGNAGTGSAAFGGGGAGGYAEGFVDVSATSSLSIVVGAQGSATTSSSVSISGTTGPYAMMATVGTTGPGTNSTNAGTAEGGQGGVGLYGTATSTGAYGRFYIIATNAGVAFSPTAPALSTLGMYGQGGAGASGALGSNGIVIINY